MLRNPGLTALVTAAVLSLAAPASQAQAQKQAVAQFDLPSQSLATALRAVGSQTSMNVLFDPPLVEGLKAPALKADLTADQAFKRLLAGSGLKHRFMDDKTVMVISATASAEPGKTGAMVRETGSMQLAVAEEAALPQSPAAQKTQESTSDTGEIEVSSTRIDGLNNKGLLQSGPNAPLYHEVLTREDIERMGVTSLDELFRRIPQTSSAATSLQGAVENTNVTGQAGIRVSTMGLRGFDSGQTVILVNGRALPRTGEFDTDGVDLDRIPLASIERIEILPYAGSAIYGSGAIGGAINIILRKEYSGRDLSVYMGTSTDGGADEYRVNFLDGRTFNQGRTSLTTTFSYNHRNPLYAGDRDYLDRALERYPAGGSALTVSGQPAFEQFVIPAFAGAPGTIVVDSPVGGLGIPGAPNARYALIPTGTSPAGSTALTPGSFTATAGQFGNGERFARSVLYEPQDSASINAQLEHEFIKDRLSAYGEFTLARNSRDYTYPQQLVASLAANDPLNPFRDDVTQGFVGRPVTIYFDATDLPDSSSQYEYESARAVMGLKGKISDRWEWSADGVYDYSHNSADNIDTTTAIITMNAPDGALPPGSASAAVRRAIYPLLADHRLFPNAASDVDRYFFRSNTSETHGRQTEGNARLTGDVFDLPAGPFRISALTKYQKWSFTTGGGRDTADQGNVLVFGVVDTPTSSSSENSRSVWQSAMEFSLPIIGKGWKPIPIESLELQGSASYETIDTVSNTNNGLFSPLEYTRHGDSQVIAAKLQLVRDLAFRASYSNAFSPPGWAAVTQPQFSFSLPGFLPDAARGNTIQTAAWTYAGGGNLDLEPEEAKSENFGVIFTPRFIPGFSLNVDYWRIRKTNAIVYVDPFNAFSNPGLYGFALTRAPLTPADSALGYTGGIVLSGRSAPFNAASVETEGFDVRLGHVLETARVGMFQFNANASFTNNFLLKTAPTAGAVDQVNSGGAGPLRLRGNGSVTWSLDRWTTSVTGRYVGHYFTAFTRPSAVYPNAVPLDGERIPAYVRWDLQIGYEMPAATGAGIRGVLSGTKWTLGINNVLNEEPAFVTGFGSNSGGTGFYNTYDDPRQRFVYLSLRKSF